MVAALHKIKSISNVTFLSFRLMCGGGDILGAGPMLQFLQSLQTDSTPIGATQQRVTIRQSVSIGSDVLPRWNTPRICFQTTL
jgi:hypothetical protein